MLNHEMYNITPKYRAPMMKTPMTDFAIQLTSLQYRKDCAPYEIMYLDCMEAYGHHQGQKKCRMILNDMHECVFKVKRMRRVVAMNKERERQFKNGERKERFPHEPPLDLF